jgi:hypothetical protein
MFDVCIYNGHPTKTTLDCRFNSEIVGVGNLFIWTWQVNNENLAFLFTFDTLIKKCKSNKFYIDKNIIYILKKLAIHFFIFYFIIFGFLISAWDAIF